MATVDCSVGLGLGTVYKTTDEFGPPAIHGCDAVLETLWQCSNLYVNMANSKLIEQMLVILVQCHVEHSQIGASRMLIYISLGQRPLKRIRNASPLLPTNTTN
jgi:hypothetical protein